MSSLTIETSGCPWVQTERSPVTLPISKKSPKKQDYDIFYIILIFTFLILFINYIL
jgi:hypothetical protein